MKNITLTFVVVLSLLTFNSCSLDQSEDGPIFQLNIKELNIEIPETKTIEVEIAELINIYRISLGLNTLKFNDVLKYQSKEHNLYMIENSEISHDNFGDRVSFIKSYTGAARVAENVAYGFTTIESLVQAWVNSEGHHQTMIGDYTHFDISAEQHPNGQWYYTNIFIKI